MPLCLKGSKIQYTIRRNRSKIYTTNTRIHDRSLSKLGIGISLKSGGASCLGMSIPSGNNVYRIQRSIRGNI